MPTERLSMRRIREVLRLKYEARLSERAMVGGAGYQQGGDRVVPEPGPSGGAVLAAAGGADDTELERRLFTGRRRPRRRRRPVPDWAEVERELRRRGVTRTLLWQEYRAEHPDGYGYSWFCEPYEAWKRRRRRRMRQTHVAGEKLFVDFAGDTMPVIDPATGEVRQAQCSSRCGRLQLHLSRRPAGARAWRTGSARTSGLSPSSAACRSCGLRQPEGRG